MKSTHRIVNPYLARKKQGPSSTAPPSSHATATEPPAKSAASGKSKGPLAAPSKAASGESSTSTTLKPVPLLGNNNPRKTLKQKLKEEIENLKRAKALQKVKAQEKKRLREQEILRRKLRDLHKEQGAAAKPSNDTNDKLLHTRNVSMSSPTPVALKPVVVSAEKASPAKTTESSVSTPLVAKMMNPSAKPTGSNDKTTATTSETKEKLRETEESINAVKSRNECSVSLELEEIVQSKPLEAPQPTRPLEQLSTTKVTTTPEAFAPSEFKIAEENLLDSQQASNDASQTQGTAEAHVTSPNLVVNKSISSQPKSTQSIQGSSVDKQENSCSTQPVAMSTLSPALQPPVPARQRESPNQTNPTQPQPAPYPSTSPMYPAYQMPYYGASNHYKCVVNPSSGIVQPHQTSAQWYNPWISYMSMATNQMTFSYPSAHYGYASPYLSSSGFSLPPSHSPRVHQTPHGPPFTQQFHAPIRVHQPNTPRVSPKHPEPKKLSENVLESPSPYAKTHKLMAQPIVLLKEEIISTFGVSMSLQSESALVDPEWLDRLHGFGPPPADAPKESANTMDSGVVKSSTETQGKEPNNMADSTVVQKRRRRRRRHVFSSMMVLDPTKQNQMGANRASLLQKGDIILQVQGKDAPGKTFAEACKLFKLPDGAVKEDGWYRISVLVARRIPPPQPKMMSPIHVPMKTRIVSPADVNRWALLRLKGLFKNSRLLGTPPTESELHAIRVEAGPSMVDLSISVLEQSWQKQVRELNRQMNTKAIEHWKAEWEKEAPDIRESLDRSYLSLSSRSRMRSAARPANACKCGSKSHLFVNDTLCPLYSNLRRLGDLTEEGTDDGTPSKPRKIKFQNRKLKAVEAAFTERIAREKEERSKEEAEAYFVDQAEQIQLRELGQSIFSPSLTSMIMSSIAALKDNFEEIKERKSKLAEKVSGDRNVVSATGNKNNPVGLPDMKEADEEDEDDDVPLVALGKRSLPAGHCISPKKVKCEATNINFECLARIIQFCSQKWGHVFREPIDGDYVWRWELFHGQTGKQKWDASAQNPRKSLSLENAQFLLNDDYFKQLHFDDEPKTPQQVEAVSILAFLADPSKTGVVDEVLALHQSDVIRIDAFGVPRLSTFWFKNVDVLVLEEMMACWNADADPLGRYGIHDTVRSLGKKWIRNDEGWALSSNPDDIIYESDEFAAWRNAFETRLEDKVDAELGVGRFGI